MKNTMRILALLAATLPIAVAAQVVKTPPEGQAYLIKSTGLATGNGVVSYQWYRNNAPIAAATDTSYIVPAQDAYGTNVEFKRLARTSGGSCGGVGEGWSNTVLVSFTPEPTVEIAGSISVCAGATDLTYSVLNTPNMTYSWTVPAGWSITAGQNTNSVTVTAGVGSGVISVTPSSTVTGHSDTTRSLAVTIIAAPDQPAAITASTTNVCSGQMGVTYSVTGVRDIAYTWSLPYGWSITAGQGTNSITATAGTVGGNVSVTASNCSGSSAARMLAVTVGAAPAQPSTISGNPTPCSGQSYTYSVTNVPGVSYNWSVPSGWSITAGQNTGSITATASSTSGTVSVMPFFCGNTGAARTLAVTVGSAPAQPDAITASTAVVCSGQTGVTYSVTNVPGVTYTWSVPSTWLITAGQGTNSITVAAGTANGNVSVTPKTTCSSNGTAQTLAVTVGAVPQPSTITASATAICPGQEVTYSVTSVQGVSYSWEAPNGWTITAGQSTYKITATAGVSGGTLRVTPSACSKTGTARTLAVAVGSAPAQPSTITPSVTAVCNGQTGISYSVTNVADVSYSWSVPAGWSITAGQSTSSITATAGWAGGNVSVTAHNCGGNSTARTLAVTVGTAPAQPSPITPSSTNICSGQTGITYTVTNVSGVDYAWTVPAGWSITAGQNTNSITATAGSAGGNVQVTPSACSQSGISRTLSVTVGAVPAIPSAIMVSSDVPCSNSTYTYSITAASQEISYTWSVPESWSINSGQGSNSISITTGPAGGTVSVTPRNCSGNGTARTRAVTLNVPPSQPSFLGGISSLTACTGQKSIGILVTNVAGVTYNWSLPSGWSNLGGSSSSSVYTLSVNAPSSVGSGTISVTASACGNTSAARTIPAATVACASPCANGEGTSIAGLCWANKNVGSYQTFAANFDSEGSFYQWNRAAAWSGNINGWNSTADNSSTWTVNPCPSGWRLPTKAEFDALIGTGYLRVTTELSNSKQLNPGYLVGPTHSICRRGDMSGCIYLPSTGWIYEDGTRISTNSYSYPIAGYWSSTSMENNTTGGYYLLFDDIGLTTYSNSKAMGYNIRCARNNN